MLPSRTSSPTPPALSPSPPPTTKSAISSAYGEIEQKTQILLHLALELGISITDAQSVGGSPGKEANAAINSMRSQMQAIHDVSLHPGLRDVRVPKEVLMQVDAVKNPHVFTKEIIERAVNENQYANAMMRNVSDYQAVLTALMEKNFPDALMPLPNMPQEDKPTKKDEDVTMKVEG